MMDWQLPHTVPRRTTVEIQTLSGKTVLGEMEPFWCGSDCPCCDPEVEEPFPPLDGEPLCWRIIGHEDETPMRWRAICNASEKV